MAEAAPRRHDVEDPGGWQRRLLRGRGREWSLAGTQGSQRWWKRAAALWSENGLRTRSERLCPPAARPLDGGSGAPRTVRLPLASKFHRLLASGADLALPPVELPPASQDCTK
uniref:Uncharacterized protein n=1 Tax=Sphaerodactylus townsendi TaxID=933632 RepID=A0ACB8FBL5_9SAUR